MLAVVMTTSLPLTRGLKACPIGEVAEDNFRSACLEVFVFRIFSDQNAKGISVQVGQFGKNGGSQLSGGADD